MRNFYNLRSSMPEIITLRDQMKQIRQKIKEERQTGVSFSQIRRSQLVYQPQYFAPDRTQSSLPQVDKSQDQELIVSHIMDLNEDNKINEENLNNFISHVNQHMNALSEAVISMESEIQMLRGENKMLTDYIVRNGMPKHQCQNEAEVEEMLEQNDQQYEESKEFAEEEQFEAEEEDGCCCCHICDCERLGYCQEADDECECECGCCQDCD